MFKYFAYHGIKVNLTNLSVSSGLKGYQALYAQARKTATTKTNKNPTPLTHPRKITFHEKELSRSKTKKFLKFFSEMEPCTL